MGRPKIGAVSYLNTKPLVVGLEAAAPDYELVFDLPSRLADRLHQGELDVALIPVIEAVLGSGYTIVSDACIGCRGPVWSVKLLSRVPGPEIRTLALDEGSRTSRALTRVLLDKQFQIQPKLQSLKMEEDWQSVGTDAVLIIGDRAMHADESEFEFTWDLGSEWNRLTDEPFVFAVWAARADSDLDRLDVILSEARDRGLRQLPELAAENAAHYQLSEQQCFRYLDEYLHFVLGMDEKSGMNRFFQYAKDLSLIPQRAQLHFHDCQTA